MNRLLLSASLLLLAAPLAAQPAFGLRAGLNVATIIPDSDNDLADRGAKLGFVGGAFVEVPVGPIALQPEVLFTQKGVTRDDAANDDIGVDYLEIPVLVKAGLPVSDFLDVDVFAGPALAVKLGASDDSDVAATRFNSTNLGVVVGGGVASGPFGVDARYTFSVQDATEGEANDFRHHVVSLTGVYRFGR